MLSLITLVLLLWGGFQMVTAAGDNNKFSAGQKILQHAAMGLAFIAASRMMVSMIFRVLNQVGASSSSSTTQKPTSTINENINKSTHLS